MTSTSWSRVAAIVHAALRHDEERRAAFVAEACGNNADLVREVESLLAHASAAADFLSTPALAMAPSVLTDLPRTRLPAAARPDATSDDESRLAPGQRFGPYRIERLLGRGGMGEVYEAEHLEHGRRIALKVLSPSLGGAIDRERFLQEGQLAAAVNHPHVVYIYGSEDIAGMPVIAMELLPGGTLRERIGQEGPLAPAEAVDAMLQIVSGLEAAHDAGVLHRDVKPSNCFVDFDGAVKVGDFGLAILALAPDVTQLAATSTFQGTPQFASPEQLRGERPDMRSDVYAVGATLYYLLTGRAPFDDRDLLALVSRIATESPTSPRAMRPEVPKGLAAVVLQCLEKNPADRPVSPRMLANMLAPFSSTSKAPAPLGIRTAAYVFDTFFSILLPANMLLGTVVVLARSSSVFSARPALVTLFAVSYFAITEGVWGASMAKALCGFRVVTESGAPPTFLRALCRALVFLLPPWLASGLTLSIFGLAYSMQGISAITAIGVEVAVSALLFLTARRANGWAGIHEVVTGTRTVVKSAVGSRARVQSAAGPFEIPAGSRSVGPYWIANDAGPLSNGSTVLARDERLRRTLWLRFPGANADPVPHVRRILRRPTRPRWLAGQRGGDLAWDAYEQVPGQPFDTLLTRAQSWLTVRRWLCNLADEVRAGLDDGSLPALQLDHVWIGNDGRASLLDWPTTNDRPGMADSPTEQAVDLSQAERFLYRFAVCALEGRIVTDTDPQARPSQLVLPRSATACLDKLREQGFVTPDDMVTALVSEARGPAAVSRTRRAMHVSLCSIPMALLMLVGVLTVYNTRPGVLSAHPEVREVSTGEAADRAGIETGDVVVAVDDEPMWFSSQLRQAIAAHADRPMTLSILRAGQPVMIRATPARSANGGHLGIAVADETVPAQSGTLAWQFVCLQAFAGLVIAGTVGLLSALTARGGIALRLVGIAVVTRNGSVASRSRKCFRDALSWLPVVAASAAAFAGHAPLVTLTPQATLSFVISPIGVPVFLPTEPSIPSMRMAFITVALAVFAIGAMIAVVKPERGLQDRLAGTWLVPR